MCWLPGLVVKAQRFGRGFISASKDRSLAAVIKSHGYTELRRFLGGLHNKSVVSGFFSEPFWMPTATAIDATRRKRGSIQQLVSRFRGNDWKWPLVTSRNRAAIYVRR